MASFSNSIEPTVPGGKFTRFILQFYALYIQACCWIAVPELIREIFRPCPKLNMNQKNTGQVCVLTGGARGIGIELCKALLALDYTVIAGVRNISVMEKQIENIREGGILSENVKLLHLDLKRLSSVKKFAEEVMSCSEAKEIHLLINNAGIYQDTYEVTPDNLEAHFQVNYLSHFYLTNLLLPRIKETAKQNKDKYCHIVNTSSIMHYGGNLQFDNLAQKKFYVPTQCYFDTKLCQILHAKTLQSQLDLEGISNLQMYAVHPGAIPTDIWSDIGWIDYLTRPFLNLFCRSPEEGAHVVLYPALTPPTLQICGGKYFENGQEKPPNSQANDYKLQEKLQQLSIKLIDGISNQ